MDNQAFTAADVSDLLNYLYIFDVAASVRSSQSHALPLQRLHRYFSHHSFVTHSVTQAFWVLAVGIKIRMRHRMLSNILTSHIDKYGRSRRSSQGTGQSCSQEQQNCQADAFTSFKPPRSTARSRSAALRQWCQKRLEMCRCFFCQCEVLPQAHTPCLTTTSCRFSMAPACSATQQCPCIALRVDLARPKELIRCSIHRVL